MTDRADTDLAEKARALDAGDPLAAARAQFIRPEGWLFFDANSVGPAPEAARAAASALVEDWAGLRRRGWSQRDWVDMPSILGDAIAPFIGAGPGEVVACDNTTVNLFKAVGHALAINSERTVLLTQDHNFPTDLHVLQGYVRSSGGRLSLRRVNSEAEALAALGEEVALFSFSHVDYKSGERWDMAALNRAARAKGVLSLWDVSHSAGAVPVDAPGTGADYIVGCGYKYLCTGPGGPAFIYVRPDLTDSAWPPLCGWMGHADIYAFSEEYEPHGGIKRFISGTPLVGANALAATSADIFRTVEPRDLWAAHRSLSEFLIEVLESLCGRYGVQVSSPRDYDRRGGHVSFRAPGAGHVVEALIADRLVSSFRKPDSIRFGISPLALTHADMVEAGRRLASILERESWRAPEFAAVSV